MKTKIIRKTVAGGLIGALLTNPRLTLAKAVEEESHADWHLTAITPLAGGNAFMFLVSILVLFCTVFLWTFGPGYLLAFEKDD